MGRRPRPEARNEAGTTWPRLRQRGEEAEAGQRGAESYSSLRRSSGGARKAKYPRQRGIVERGQLAAMEAVLHVVQMKDELGRGERDQEKEISVEGFRLRHGRGRVRHFRS